MAHTYPKLTEPEPAVRDRYKELKSVDGKVVGYNCIECGRLHTAPHFETCLYATPGKPSYEELERQLAEAKRDSARLDWMDKMETVGTVAWKAMYPNEYGFAWMVGHEHKGKDLREAIDAAMCAEEPRK